MISGGFGHQNMNGGFKADISIHAVGRFVNASKQISRHTDIFDRQCFINFIDAFFGLDQFLDGFVIVVAAGDGFLKDGRIGGNSTDTLVDYVCSSPEVISERRIKSNHTDWPNFSSSISFGIGVSSDIFLSLCGPSTGLLLRGRG